MVVKMLNWDDYVACFYIFKPYNAELILYKLWRPKRFNQFEIIINVLVSSF